MIDRNFCHTIISAQKKMLTLLSIIYLIPYCDSGAIQLDPSNIDGIVQNNDLVIINFYADWCRYNSNCIIIEMHKPWNALLCICMLKYKRTWPMQQSIEAHTYRHHPSVHCSTGVHLMHFTSTFTKVKEFVSSTETLSEKIFII